MPVDVTPETSERLAPHPASGPASASAITLEEDALDATLERLEIEHEELTVALKSFGEDVEVLIRNRALHALFGHVTTSGAALPDKKSAPLPEDQSERNLFLRLHSAIRQERRDALEEVNAILEGRLANLRASIDELSDELFDVDDPSIAERPSALDDEDSLPIAPSLSPEPRASGPARS